MEVHACKQTIAITAVSAWSVTCDGSGLFISHVHTHRRQMMIRYRVCSRTPLRASKVRRMYDRLRARIGNVVTHAPLTYAELDDLCEVLGKIAVCDAGEKTRTLTGYARLEVRVEEIIQGILDDTYEVATVWRNRGPVHMLDDFEDIRFPACVTPASEFLKSENHVQDLANMRKELDLRVLKANGYMKPQDWEHIIERDIDDMFAMSASLVHIHEHVEIGWR